MDSKLKKLRENLEKMKEVIEKDFGDSEVVFEEVDGILEKSYKMQLLSSFATSVPYHYIYKLNQIMNPISQMLISWQRRKRKIGFEDVFNDKQKSIMRFLSSFHILYGEIQLLIEQGYILQAYGRLRIVLEQLVIFKYSLIYEDLHIDALNFGNYHFANFEDFFNPSLTNETKQFTEYMEKEYEEKQLKRDYYFIEKYIGKGFVMSHEFKKMFEGDEIFLQTWNTCHSFTHASAMLLSISDRPELDSEMSKYALQLLMYSIFKTNKIIIDEFKESWDEPFDKFLYEFKLAPFKDMIEMVSDFTDEVCSTEKMLIDFIEKRKQENNR